MVFRSGTIDGKLFIGLIQLSLTRPYQKRYTSANWLSLDWKAQSFRLLIIWIHLATSSLGRISKTSFPSPSLNAGPMIPWNAHVTLLGMSWRLIALNGLTFQDKICHNAISWQKWIPRFAMHQLFFAFSISCHLFFSASSIHSIIYLFYV